MSANIEVDKPIPIDIRPTGGVGAIHNEATGVNGLCQTELFIRHIWGGIGGGDDINKREGSGFNQHVFEKEIGQIKADHK